MVPLQTDQSTPVVGVDVGIANFLTTSTGKHYGTFHGKLHERQKRDREKRRRKAKLRRCLEQKGAQTLPSTTSRSGQRLARHVRQEINRAVNECLAEHQGAQFAYEQLSVATMKFKARAQNAYLYASNLAHIPEQIAWNGPSEASEQRESRARIPHRNAACAIIRTGRTDRTSKRFAAWSVVIRRTLISTQQRISQGASGMPS